MIENNSQNSTESLNLVNVGDLYAAPREPVTYLVDGLLQSGGLSVLAGKPKAGKSTLCRQLAVAVAQGNPFLNSRTSSGLVIYLGLEEKPSEVADHFQLLGLTSCDSVRVLCGSIPREKAVAMLDATLKSVGKTSLVIIDPIFRFVHVRDSNDYIQVTNALEPILGLSRRFGTHILMVHHLKKSKQEDVMDGVLGSTAIAGAVDTCIALTVEGSGVRSIETRQRYAPQMEPTQLAWNAEQREFSLGSTVAEVDREAEIQQRQQIQNDIVTYVAATSGCTQEGIMNSVRGRKGAKIRALQALTDLKILCQTGEGIKGSPYQYAIATPVEN